MTITQSAYQAFSLFKEQQANLHGVPVVFINEGKQFSVNPKVQLKWHKNIYASDDLLSKIHTGTCKEVLCSDLGLVTPTTIISSRTNTADRKKPRKPKNLGGTSGIEYRAATTDFDTSLPYSKLNEWATEPEFQILVNEFYFKQKRDEIRMIGWNGIEQAEETDSTVNELGEDVNIGWLQRVRTHKPEHAFKDKIGELAVTVGKTGTFKNLDDLVTKAVAVIPPQLRKNLVVFASDNMLLDRASALYAGANNKDLADSAVSIARKEIGGKPTYAADYFPENTIFITTFENLAHITQIGSIRQSIKDNDEYSCVDRFSQSNEFYGLGDYDRAVLIEGIVFVEEDANEGGA